MTPAAEAAYALAFNVSRDDLKPEVQAEYDRLLQVRGEAAHALDFNVSRDDLKPEVQAEYDRLLKVRRAHEPVLQSGMTVDDATGAVTVWERGTAVLYGDDHGLTVGKPSARARRVGWAEISRFEDGGDAGEDGAYWTLVIVLHTGQKVATRLRARAPAPEETLTAIRWIADLHGIAADVAGVPIKDGKPVRRGLYHDPGGQAGLRYWDGTQWSPLLPPDIASPKRVASYESPASWSSLPTAEGHW